MLTLAEHLLTVVLTLKSLVINDVDIVDTFPRYMLSSLNPFHPAALALCALRRSSISFPFDYTYHSAIFAVRFLTKNDRNNPQTF